MLSSSANLFAHALELDPHDTSALLALAALREKIGVYAEAVGFLRRLLKIDPHDPEARLRLAVNLRRTGDAAESQRLLEALTEGDGKDWVSALAFQELAATHFAAGRTKPALAVVRQGLTRFPADPALLTQLSFYLERGQEPGAAQAAAERVASAPATGDTARLQYNRWPHEGLEDARRRIVESATPRLRVLAEALQLAPVAEKSP